MPEKICIDCDGKCSGPHHAKVCAACGQWVCALCEDSHDEKHEQEEARTPEAPDTDDIESDDPLDDPIWEDEGESLL